MPAADAVDTAVLCSVQALLNSSHMFYEAQKHFKGFGVNVEGLSFDWGQIQKQKDDAVSGLTKGIEGLFKKNKVRPAATRHHSKPRASAVNRAACHLTKQTVMQSLCALTLHSREQSHTSNLAT